MHEKKMNELTHSRESEKKLLIDMEHTVFFRSYVDSMFIFWSKFYSYIHAFSHSFPFFSSHFFHLFKRIHIWFTFYANETHLPWFFFFRAYATTSLSYFQCFNTDESIDAVKNWMLLIFTRFRRKSLNDLAVLNNQVGLSRGANRMCSIFLFFTMSEKSFRSMSHFHYSTLRIENANERTTRHTKRKKNQRTSC